MGGKNKKKHIKNKKTNENTKIDKSKYSLKPNLNHTRATKLDIFAALGSLDTWLVYIPPIKKNKAMT